MQTMNAVIKQKTRFSFCNAQDIYYQLVSITGATHRREKNISQKLDNTFRIYYNILCINSHESVFEKMSRRAAAL